MTLQKDLIRQARDLARQNGRPLWEVFEMSIVAYLASHAAVSGNEKKTT